MRTSVAGGLVVEESDRLEVDDTASMAFSSEDSSKTPSSFFGIRFSGGAPILMFQRVATKVKVRISVFSDSVRPEESERGIHSADPAGSQPCCGVNSALVRL
ncbi:MAG: hypothetical protein H7A45_05275 [Verrucomicrobiales bacterium]|nr:hypothetical protein [Verrucomicrobiales bacterium]